MKCRKVYACLLAALMGVDVIGRLWDGDEGPGV